MYGDRKIWAAVQMRRGPNVVGALRLLQSLADCAEIRRQGSRDSCRRGQNGLLAGADGPALVLAMIAWAVIPFNDTWVLADINVAILYVFAVVILGGYGVIMGGWASNSKYPFLGSLAVRGADDFL